MLLIGIMNALCWPEAYHQWWNEEWGYNLINEFLEGQPNLRGQKHFPPLMKLIHRDKCKEKGEDILYS